jgi:hypothetical protein
MRSCGSCKLLGVYVGLESDHDAGATRRSCFRENVGRCRKEGRLYVGVVDTQTCGQDVAS